MITLEGTRRALQRRRVMTWLLMHRSAWESQTFGPRTESKRILYETLQKVGIYSESSKWFDSNLDRVTMECREILRRRDEGNADGAKRNGTPPAGAAPRSSL